MKLKPNMAVCGNENGCPLSCIHRGVHLRDTCCDRGCHRLILHSDTCCKVYKKESKSVEEVV